MGGEKTSRSGALNTLSDMAGKPVVPGHGTSKFANAARVAVSICGCTGEEPLAYLFASDPNEGDDVSELPFGTAQEDIGRKLSSH